MKKITGLTAILTLLILAGCYNDKYNKLYPLPASTTCDTSTITYSHDIAPIITANCYSSSANGGGCHDAAGAATSGYDYQTSVTVIQGNALNGTLLGDLNWVARHNNMPKNGNKLPDCDINKITRWVNQGALNN